jgi:hypothetical protein
MSAEQTHTFPPHALRIWMHERRIYVSYPSAAGNGPLVIAYDAVPASLTTILAAMAKADAEAHPLPRSTASAATRTAPPGQRRHSRVTPASGLSDDDKRRALDALIAVGILPPSAGN